MPMRSIPHSHQSRRCCMAPTMLMCNPNFIRIKVHFREHEIKMTTCCGTRGVPQTCKYYTFEKDKDPIDCFIFSCSGTALYNKDNMHECFGLNESRLFDSINLCNKIWI